MGPGLGQVVDSIGQAVGTLVDPKAGIVFRQLGSDWVVFTASPAGLVPEPVTFFHTQANCQGPRFVWNFNMGGFAYFGQIASSTVFYTVQDPSHIENVLSSEVVAPNATDPSQMGACTDWGGAASSMTVGAAISTTELSTLVAPFKIQ